MTPYDLFYNNKLGQLPYIKRDGLKTILQKEFYQTTINYNENQLTLLNNILVK